MKEIKPLKKKKKKKKPVTTDLELRSTLIGRNVTRPIKPHVIYIIHRGATLF